MPCSILVSKVKSLQETQADSVQTNAAGQTITETDTTGLTTRSEWDNGDRLLWSTDPAGLRTSTIYDPYRHWPTDTYGPAPESCFNGQTPNGTCTVARSSTGYDEAMTGPGSSYFPNKNLIPQAGMYDGTLNNGLNRTWGTGSPVSGIPADGFSARFSGDLRFPQAGTYNLRVYADDGFRLFIDDKKVAEDWIDGAGSHTLSYTNAVAGARRKISVEFYENTGDAQLQLFWTPPGGTETLVPAAEFGPRYGLETSTVDADGKRTETKYDLPAQGLVSATISDASGRKLTSTTTYEPVSNGYRRPTRRQLPKGPTTEVKYEYWGNSEATNPCDPTTAPIQQAGHLRRVTEPDPDGATGTQAPIIREHFYDAAGRVIGNKVNDEAWACTAYDTRGRVRTQRDHLGGTTTYDYSTTPGVITATFPNSSGATRTTRTESDILGRIIRYTDELGTVTRTAYDIASRVTNTYRTFTGQTETQLTSTSFDGFGRPSGVTDHLTGTARTTTLGYDTAGRQTTTSRPNGVVTTSGFNPNTGRVNSINHTSGTQTLVAWTAEHTLGGDVKNETTAGRTRAYTYDGAGRLTGVNDAGTLRAYAYDDNTNRCGTTANTCSTSWEYDHADKAVKTPGATYSYDPLGNTKAITPTTGTATTFTYDANNHATVIDDPTRKTEESLTPDGRVLTRKVTTKATNQVTEHLEYGYDSGSDSPAYQRPVGAGGAATTYLDGPGGLLAIQTGTTTTWPLPNGRGDIVGTTDNAGAYTAKPVVDEFGKGTVTTDRLGWLGTHQRYTAATSSGIIRMGHRLYDPRIGRFLSVDPVEGGSCNDYDYVCANAINDLDLDGLRCFIKCGWGKAAKRVRRAGSNFARRAVNCRLDAGCTLSYYGTISASACFYSCIGASVSRSGGQLRRSVGVSLCCSMPGGSLMFTPGSRVARRGASGSYSAGGCLKICLARNGATGSRVRPYPNTIGIGTRGGFASTWSNYTW